MHDRRSRSALSVVAALVMSTGALLVTSADVGAVAGATSTVFINEIHYDNAGADAGEAVEVAGPAGTDLTGWSIVLYNGSTGLQYGTLALSGTLTDQSGGYGFANVPGPGGGIQNGSPDGIALVNGTTVVQFLSYEGTLTAADGLASGQLSTDIGVSQNGSEALGLSLQLAGTGTVAGDFTWQVPATATPGAVNNGQTFEGVVEPLTPVLNEFSVSTTGIDVEYFETIGEPTTDHSAYSIVVVRGTESLPATPGQVLSAHTLGTSDADGRELIDLASNTVINSAITLVLVENFTGAVGDDLDPTDDGTFDTTPWDAIADSVSIGTGTAYSATVLDAAFDDATYTGNSAAFAPGGASRLPDRTGAWVRNDFDLAGIPGFTGTEEDGEALNTPGAENAPTDPPVVIEDKLIHEVQGSGATVAITTPVTIEGIVTTIIESADGVGGNYFVQEEDADADADPNTSEGIYVFCGGSCPAVAVGDQVQISGTPAEFSGMSQMTAITATTVVSSGNALPLAVPVALPAAAPTDNAATFEAIEGMHVTFPDTLAVSEYFQLARFGEIVLSAGGRPGNFTDTNAPSIPGYAAFLTELAKKQIILDDDSDTQNDDVVGAVDEPYPYPTPGLSLTNRVRGGDTIAGLTGVLQWGFNAWRVRPIPTVDYTFTPVNTAPSVPATGGNMTVASFNVLNFFTTIDSRGADSASELDRQSAKIVAAINDIDADVVGLIEIENNTDAIERLVTDLNTAAGETRWNFVDTGVIGTDEIKVAYIYQPSEVAPFGAYAVLDDSIDPTFGDEANRPALIQTFEDLGSGELITVAVNHLKSKGSACTADGDPDVLDGQGNCNLTRTAAATALVNYLATDPTGSGSDDFLIIGDLNAYRNEDPITAIKNAGYTDLMDLFGGAGAYSYVFDGQLGYLDHALASTSLTAKVTGAGAWHINADEVPLFDYNDDIKDGTAEADFERESSALPLFAPDPLRSSDHDPVVIGLQLTPPPPPVAVLVAGNPTPGLPDQPIVALTERIGFEVVIVDDNTANLAAAVLSHDPSVVLVSSSVLPATVSTKLSSLDVGVVTWEGFLYDEFGFTSGKNKNGETPLQRFANIITPSHPIADGRSGSVAVTQSTRKMSYARPTTGTIVAVDTAGRAVITAWGEGESLAVGTAPAPRVAMFPVFNSPPSFTAAGIDLMENAILWAAAG